MALRAAQKYCIDVSSEARCISTVAVTGHSSSSAKANIIKSKASHRKSTAVKSSSPHLRFQKAS